VSRRFVSPPISLAPLARRFQRADLVFHGLDHSGSSYEVRVFFNRPDATEETPTTEAEGYVASFFMFGHGGCAGQPGHCDVPESRRPGDVRPPHQLTPATRWITVTDAVRRTMDAGEVTVTAVPIVRSWRPGGRERDPDAEVMAVERVALVAYDSPTPGRPATS
jgi:hypothetical protein